MSAQREEPSGWKPPARTPAAIRANLLPETLPAFDADFQKAVRTLGETYDLAGVQDCIERWWPSAVLASHHPGEHRQAMRDAERLLAGEEIETIGWEDLAPRLGLPSTM